MRGTGDLARRAVFKASERRMRRRARLVALGFVVHGSSGGQQQFGIGLWTSAGATPDIIMGRVYNIGIALFCAIGECLAASLIIAPAGCMFAASRRERDELTLSPDG